MCEKFLTLPPDDVTYFDPVFLLLQDANDLFLCKSLSAHFVLQCLYGITGLSLLLVKFSGERSSPLRYRYGVHDVIDCPTSFGRTQKFPSEISLRI